MVEGTCIDVYLEDWSKSHEGKNSTDDALNMKGNSMLSYQSIGCSTCGESIQTGYDLQSRRGSTFSTSSSSYGSSTSSQVSYYNGSYFDQLYKTRHDQEDKKLSGEMCEGSSLNLPYLGNIVEDIRVKAMENEQKIACNSQNVDANTFEEARSEALIKDLRLKEDRRKGARFKKRGMGRKIASMWNGIIVRQKNGGKNDEDRKIEWLHKKLTKGEQNIISTKIYADAIKNEIPGGKIGASISVCKEVVDKTRKPSSNKIDDVNKEKRKVKRIAKDEIINSMCHSSSHPKDRSINADLYKHSKDEGMSVIPKKKHISSCHIVPACNTRAISRQENTTRIAPKILKKISGLQSRPAKASPKKLPSAKSKISGWKKNLRNKIVLGGDDQIAGTKDSNDGKRSFHVEKYDEIESSPGTCLLENAIVECDDGSKFASSISIEETFQNGTSEDLDEAIELQYRDENAIVDEQCKNDDTFFIASSISSIDDHFQNNASEDLKCDEAIELQYREIKPKKNVKSDYPGKHESILSLAEKKRCPIPNSCNSTYKGIDSKYTFSAHKEVPNPSSGNKCIESILNLSGEPNTNGKIDIVKQNLTDDTEEEMSTFSSSEVESTCVQLEKRSAQESSQESSKKINEHWRDNISETERYTKEMICCEKLGLLSSKKNETFKDCANNTSKIEDRTNSRIFCDKFGTSATEGLKLCEGEPVKMPNEESSDILVKVEACTVSKTDILIRSNKWRGRRIACPFTPGVDFVGRIEKCGNNASLLHGWKQNDRVASLIACGGNAKYVTTCANNIVRVPEGIDAVAAACVLENYLAAFQLLHTGIGIKGRYSLASLTGKQILVIGGISMISQAVIELAKICGVAKIFTTALPKHHDFLSTKGAISLGVDPHSWLPIVKDKIDIVIDGKFEDKSHSSWQALNSNGTLVCYGSGSTLHNGHDLGSVMETYWTRGVLNLLTKAYVYDVFDSWENNFDLCKNDISHLFRLLEAKLLVPDVAATISLSNILQAQSYIESPQRVQGTFVCQPFS